MAYAGRGDVLNRGKAVVRVGTVSANARQEARAFDQCAFEDVLVRPAWSGAGPKTGPSASGESWWRSAWWSLWPSWWST